MSNAAITILVMLVNLILWGVFILGCMYYPHITIPVVGILLLIVAFGITGSGRKTDGSKKPPVDYQT